LGESLIVAATATRSPRAYVKINPAAPAIAELGWETEGGDQATLNILRAPIGLHVWAEDVRRVIGQNRPAK